MTRKGAVQSILSWPILLSAVLVFAGGMRSPARDYSCYTRDSVATRFLAWGRRLGKGADSSVVQARRLLHVAQAPESAVTIVTDPRVCGRLAGAYATAMSAEVTRVYAIRVGQVYAVFDPTVKAGEWNVVVTFDSTYRKLGSVLR